ncbi:Auxin-induced protein [Macleaya cordata]|uniref:Auxin-induced protein n=1 Tax=Macleaya cordata TaxID=56857 RepID=A0A200R9A3_MACCD|nr:Auxin-induced protein [Macleaya cordata]
MSPGYEIWKIVRPPTKEFLRLLNVLSSNRKGISLESNDDSKEKLLSRETMKDLRNSRNLREVPRGYLAVYVGSESQRFVIPATYLSFPDFRVLMERVEEEFGFEQEGGLRIPCEENDFEEVLIRCFEMHRKMKKKKSGKR